MKDLEAAAAAVTRESLQVHKGSHDADQDHAASTAHTLREMIILCTTRDDSDRLIGNTCHDSRQYMHLSSPYIDGEV